MKAPRFCYEYRNYKIKAMEKLIETFPENETLYRDKINTYLKITRNLERGLVTIDEFMKVLSMEG